MTSSALHRCTLLAMRLSLPLAYNDHNRRHLTHYSQRPTVFVDRYRRRTLSPVAHVYTSRTYINHLRWPTTTHRRRCSTSTGVQSLRWCKWTRSPWTHHLRRQCHESVGRCVLDPATFHHAVRLCQASRPVARRRVQLFRRDRATTRTVGRQPSSTILHNIPHTWIAG